MKIFITLGTTPFDGLIQYCDENIDHSKYTIKAQISNQALYHAKHFESFEYTNDIQGYYDWADVVISHAGAGSFYKLMEHKKKVIFVPNVTLKDNHQDDLCRYAEMNNFAFVLNDYANLNVLLEKMISYEFNIYQKEENKIAEYIIGLINEEIRIRE